MSFCRGVGFKAGRFESLSATAFFFGLYALLTSPIMLFSPANISLGMIDFARPKRLRFESDELLLFFFHFDQLSTICASAPFLEGLLGRPFLDIPTSAFDFFAAIETLLYLPARQFLI